MSKRNSGTHLALDNGDATVKGAESILQSDTASDLPEASITRDERIRQAAYVASERRGFVPGFETKDWLEAEKQIDLEDKSVAPPVKAS